MDEKVDEHQQQEEIKRRAEQRFNEIVTKAISIPGTSDNCELNKIPEWFDAKKYERCIYLARKYFVSLYIAHFIGLLTSIQLSNGLYPLLATGNSATVPKLFRRYLSTLIHVKNWYECNPFTRDSNSWKSMQQVRGMHKKVAQLMNSRTGVQTEKDKVWINQYAFVITQWAFIGPVILYPKHCGLHPASDEDIEHLVYLWRVIGYCIGIEEQFNICSGNIEENRVLCQMIFDREYRPTLHKNALEPEIGWNMGNGIAIALRMINPSLRFEAIIYYWYARLGIPHKVKLDSFIKKLAYYFLFFNFQIMFRYSISHWIYGWVYKLLIYMATKRKLIRELYLKNTYPNLRYEEKKCPLNIDIGYTDAFNEKMIF